MPGSGTTAGRHRRETSQRRRRDPADAVAPFAGPLRGRAISLRWKIILLAAGSVVLTAAFVVSFTYGPTLAQMEESLDRAGVGTAELLAALGPAAVSSVSGESAERFDREILRGLLDREGLRGDLIDAAVTVQGGAVSARGQASSLVDRRVVRPGGPTSVAIYASTYHPHGGVPVPAREYARSFRTSGGAEGTAYVVLSADRLARAPAAFTARIFAAAALAGIAGAALALWTGAYLCRPLRRLVDDMRAVRQGDRRRRSAVSGTDEVGRLAAAFNEMVEAIDRGRETEVESEVMKRELALAARIQSHLVPSGLPDLPGWEAAARYRPFAEVGGDLLDVAALGDGRRAILIADVSGKGVPGALVMAIARSYFRAEAPSCRSSRELLGRMNAHLCRDVPRGMFVTALVIAIDPAGGRLEVCSAGHSPLVLARTVRSECGLVNTSGLALGIHDGPLFEHRLRAASVDLRPGDRIVAYTDGLVEATDAKGRDYGVERLCALVGRHARSPSESLLSLLVMDLEHFCGREGCGDDVSLFTLRRSDPVAGARPVVPSLPLVTEAIVRTFERTSA